MVRYGWYGYGIGEKAWTSERLRRQRATDGLGWRTDCWQSEVHGWYLG